jgi:hypothetical protein
LLLVPETTHLVKRLPWIAVLGVLAVLVTVVAPGRGAAWFNDDGMFLVLSWNTANGFGLDRTIPQAPHYLFHAVLMKLGLRELLHFRILNYLVSLVSSMVFFLGLDSRRFRSPIVPVAVCAGLLVSLNSIQSPNSLAMAFCLLGAGSYFFAVDAVGRWRSALLAASGALFAISGFMHAAVAIAMVVLIGLIVIFDRSVRRAPLWPIFLAVSVGLWGVYIRVLGLDNLFVVPGGHNARPGHLVRALWHIGTLYLEAALVYAVTAAAFWWTGRRKFAAAQAVLSIAATLFYGATFLADIAGLRPPPAVLGWFFLSGEGQWISRVPGTVFYILLFAAFRCVAEAWPRVHRNWLIATAALALLHVATQVGSNTAVIQGMVFFAGPALGLGVMLWHALDRQDPPPWRVFAPVTTAWLVLLTTFTFAYNHPTVDGVLLAGRTRLHEPPLTGVLVTPRYASAVARFTEAYAANGCQALPIIAFEYIPMAEYILQRRGRPGGMVIRPSMDFPAERIRAALDPAGGWCVLDTTGLETQIAITRSGTDMRSAVREWVAARSDRSIVIPSPGPDLTDIRLYVRDARTVHQ